jgi:hypothetical protein
VRLAPDDVQLLLVVRRDPHARLARPTWEIADLMRTPRKSTQQKLRRLHERGLLSRQVKGAEDWWGVTQRAVEALELVDITGAARAGSPGASAAAAAAAADGGRFS